MSLVPEVDTAGLYTSLDNLFREEQTSNMATIGSDPLAALRDDPKRTAEIAAALRNDLTPPGHMLKDKAQAYMQQIYHLFPGKDEELVQLGLGAWAATHDVGGTQNFASKPAVVVAGHSVPATRIFGEIIPVTDEGEPRQFCGTMFEHNFDMILAVHPELRTLLAKRCADAGLPVTDPSSVVSFIKGVTPSTVGSVNVRAGAKATLIAKDVSGRHGGGAKQTAAGAVAGSPLVGEQQFGSGHNLY